MAVANGSAVKHSHSSLESPTLLILDYYSSHLSIDAIQYCQDHGVIMLTLPSHCIRKKQFLEGEREFFHTDLFLFIPLTFFEALND